jgi:hypothetical protein
MQRGKKDYGLIRCYGSSVAGRDFTTVLVKAVVIGPTTSTVLRTAFAIAVLSHTDCMGMGQAADSPARAAVVLVGVEVDLAPVLLDPIPFQQLGSAMVKKSKRSSLIH